MTPNELWTFIQGNWFATLAICVPSILSLVTKTSSFLDSCKNIKLHWEDWKKKRKGCLLSDNELSSQSLMLSKDIYEFTKERQSTEPSLEENNFEELGKLLSAHMRETQQLYAEKFLSKVKEQRDEFMKRNITNEDVEMLHEFPTNYFGLNDLASGLQRMSTQLSSKGRKPKN